MIPAVKERMKNAPFFYKCYYDICKLHHVMPISFIKRHIDENTLDLCGDRVKIDDWMPVMDALKCDRSLCFIAIRSKCPEKKVLEQIDTLSKARTVKRHPVILTRFVLRRLMNCLATCISETSLVECMELESLPLKHEYMKILCKGLSKNTTLQTISFHGCQIGDEGCKQLCLLIKNMSTLFHLDLSNCNLSSKSAVNVADMLKYQSLHHYAEGWKQSLRYRDPSLESMPGLRRIILNNNVLIRDEGIKHLAEALKEDIWLKAIDLQNCGVSKVGAQCLLDMLDVNVTLYIVDVRDNAGIDSPLINKIMLKLLQNNANKSIHEYNWTIPQSQLSHKFKACSHVKYTARYKCDFSHKQSGCIICRTPMSTSKSKNYSASTAQRQLKQPSTIPCSSQPIETKQKLKEVLKKLEAETSLRRNAELNQEELKTRVHELEKELLKEKENKEGFCFMKVDAYEAVLETFRRFFSFMEYVKKANETMNQEEKITNSSNEMGFNRNSLETHVKNIVKLTMEVQENEWHSSLRRFPQDITVSLMEAGSEISTRGNFDAWSNVKDPIQRENGQLLHSSIALTSPNMNLGPSKQSRSCISTATHSESVSSKNNMPVTEHCLSSLSTSHIKELYDKYVVVHSDSFAV